jgi:sugar lactone lactonase YvrE
MSAGCGSTASSETTDPATTTTLASTTTTAPEATTTLGSTTTTAGNTPLDYLLELGYTFSDEYVVETVIRGIDSGTGGLAVDSDGTMYQGDFGYSGHVGNSVYRIQPDGTVEVFAQSDEMESLTMTAFGADGNLYQSSYGTGKVFRIDSDGHTVVVAEGIGGPTGIVALEDGTLFIEGYNTGILHKVTPDGTMTDFAEHPDFDGINGLTIGPDGTLYVADHRDGGLFSVDQSGEVTKLHEFPWQTSHVAYLDGSLFVTSRGIFLVYRYDLETGDVEIIAGNTEPGDADGRGIESSFGRPNAITVGPDGALYFNHADGENNNPVHIRKIIHQP